MTGTEVQIRKEAEGRIVVAVTTPVGTRRAYVTSDMEYAEKLRKAMLAETNLKFEPDTVWIRN
jgi:hypothetical protein